MMSLSKRHIKIIASVILLTTFLTWFFYAHETLPKPIRAATALIETPVAIASGLSYYLKLGIDVNYLVATLPRGNAIKNAPRLTCFYIKK